MLLTGSANPWKYWERRKKHGKKSDCHKGSKSAETYTGRTQAESVRICQSQYRQSGTGNFLYCTSRVLYRKNREQPPVGVCRGVCGWRNQRNKRKAQGWVPDDDFRLWGWEHRPDPYEIHHKICKKYGGMHPDHPKAEGDWRWNLLWKREYQHAVRKKRAVHYHPGIGGAGGIRKHLKQQPMGDTETLSGWNLYHIDASVWLWKRRGWKFSHHRIRGRNRKVDLWVLLKRHGSVCDSKGTEPERHSNNPGCRKVAGRGDTGHSEKSHLWGRYASAEDIYRNKVPICPQGKQRTEKPVSHQRQPSANRHTWGGRSGTQPDGIPGGCTAHEQEWLHQKIPVFRQNHLRRVRKNLPAAENLHRETIWKNHLDVQRTCGG